MMGLGLSAEGEQQAVRLAEFVARHRIDVVQSSPLERAQQTAAAIGNACGCETETIDALNEIDFGDWTGREFTLLASDAGWRIWNDQRSTARPPQGESMAAAQMRISGHLHAAASKCDGKTLAMVTHCDIIRAAVADVLGFSLDRVHQFDIDPASVSRMVIGDWGARILSINEGG